MTTASVTHERVLPLEGVHNFRDYGGYPVAGGGRLQRGRLWRSGQHHGATASDLKHIAALGLTHVFDLRTSRERTSHPCRRPDGFGANVHFSDDPAARHAPHLIAALAAKGATAEAMHDCMVDVYKEICFRRELQGAIRVCLADLAGNDGASGVSLVNCLAGKDRTGITVAMVHLAAGVHRDDVMEDYLLTNTAGDPEARIAAGADAIRAITGNIPDDAMRVLMGVHPDYLLTGFGSAEARYGSLDGYLEQALGVDATMREGLRENLVEDMVSAA